MQIVENIPSYCYNARNDTHIDKCYWCIPKDRIWLKQAANLYEDPLKMSRRTKKTSLQDIKELI